jgi:hypothetical protein
MGETKRKNEGGEKTERLKRKRKGEGGRVKRTRVLPS